MRLAIIFILFASVAFGQNTGYINLEGGGSGAKDTVYVLDSSATIYKSKPTSQDNSTQTYADITDLDFDLEAGETYQYEYHLFFAQIPNGGIELIADFSQNVTEFRYGYITSEGDGTTNIGKSVGGSGGSSFYSTTSQILNATVFMISGYVVTDEATTMKIRFRNADSDGGTNTCRYGSWGKITKL